MLPKSWSSTRSCRATRPISPPARPERISTAAAALAAADETVRIVEDRFRAGVVKSIDLLDAATARREAEMRELVARAEAWLTHLHLALAAGLAPETVLRTSTPQS